MNDTLIILLAEIFNKRIKENKDGYLIIKFAVPMQILSGLYEKLKNFDVPPIETLPIEEKQKYWGIAKQFYETEYQATTASKAAYMISLITNTN